MSNALMMGNTSNAQGGGVQTMSAFTYSIVGVIASTAIPAGGVVLGSTEVALTVNSISYGCSSNGGAAVQSVDFWFAPSGTALTAGTKMNTAAFQFCGTGGPANNSVSNIGLTNIAIPAGSWFGIVNNGGGTNGTVQTGAFTMQTTP